jgi:CheY-like chemotaxis protein
MASIPRILAVDETYQIAEILRGTMALMDRRFILIEIPTAEGALAELHESHADLLVTAYTLPDSTGTELAARAIRESAGTPVIVLASSDDPELEPGALENVSYTYLTRPVGEQFLRALRIGLDGEAAVSVQEARAEVSTGLELGPVPEVSEDVLRDNLMSMMRDTTSIGAFIADRLGRVVVSEGITGYFDINVCAATLGPHFASTVDLRESIGGNAWTLQYFDGENYDLFAMALGLHYFAVLIFDGSKRAAFGPVTRYGREGADAIIEKIGGDAAWSYRRKVSKVTQSMQAVNTDELAKQASAGDSEDDPATPAPQESAPPIEVPDLKLDPVEDLDVDTLFNQKVDESAFDDLFTEEEMTQENVFISKGNNVSFDDAMNLGILDE